ncbi:MAG TPA: ADP-glyceromanno-heptose 6-epimerase [Geminicoccaceae bacterium]|nr:ADP-glyceromanno-heptose 6-epimerase [Geminicoccus sp.]HMU50829.1 ADP-glyceromanno-heptose 6-epimerase [Geminicoccaceae bacterium]
MILVTGGAGFIGSCLLAALEQRGHALVVCDQLGRDDKWRNIARRGLADIVAPAGLPAWLGAAGRELEAVFHLGAISSTVETDADLIVESNFRLTMRLWDWCAGHGVPLIYASSAATYGDGSDGFQDGEDPVAMARLRPLNAYGWSKLVTDRRIAGLVASGAPRPPQWAGLRFFNVYGPNEYHKGGQRSLVPQIHAGILAGGEARLFRSYRPDYPDGGQLRDFVWVDDVVAVMLWLLDHPEVSGIFNVGSGRARSFADLARAVFAAMGRPEHIRFVDMPEPLRARYQYYTQADLGRLRAAGCPLQPVPLEEGVRRYVQDHLDAADPYR